MNDVTTKRITIDGKCPQCSKQIITPDRDNPSRHYYLIKSMIVSDDGDVSGKCGRCKTELAIPVIKMPKQITIPRKK